MGETTNHPSGEEEPKELYGCAITYLPEGPINFKFEFAHEMGTFDETQYREIHPMNDN